MSNFGVHALTVVPYSLAFALGSFYLMLAGRALRPENTNLKLLKIMLYIFSGQLLLVLISTYPYKLNRTFDTAHNLAGILLFAFEFAACAWFAFFLDRNPANIAIFIVQLTGIALAAATFLGYLHVLFLAQILAGISFAFLIVRTVSHSTKTSPIDA